MPTTADEPLGTLIPSLPNEVALQCLARVPRQYHLVLAAVSKPIRSLLASPDFFAVRSSLNCSELLFYLRVVEANRPLWFMVHRNAATGNTKVARLPTAPQEPLVWSDCAVVGPNIYDLGCRFSTEVWIFNCGIHTWERGPSLPKMRSKAVKHVVLEGKIYAIGGWTAECALADVFDTVTGRWEALPSPKLRVYGEPVVGCAIRSGKVCVWLKREELRFDPATRTWEVFKSRAGSELHSSVEICEVNGVLCSLDPYSIPFGKIKHFDERTGVWRPLKLVGDRGLLNLNDHLMRPWMFNVRGRLVLIGTEYFRGGTRVWCGVIEVVKNVGDECGDFRGEVLWSEIVFWTNEWVMEGRKPPLFYACLPVSL
ncbi:F-box/kelch-repeat protein SKIP6 [Morus notabilis]|uniref:F-box/kelch-repeat protein SKIP6 n=1 Tax=Morus notabilis TaxID=981085 RepID=W9S018_9ROSA|nr:F-box/kelch-repeat protein SKIP6 [Morus notabilis]EXC19729.1 F-box/kelch-repeat protein SKIP6 [Morus notabilis]